MDDEIQRYAAAVWHSLQTDIPLFAGDLTGHDTLAVVIRSHLHVEHHMTRLIEANVLRPLFLPEIKFADKINWCIAFGLDESLRSPLEALGELRNKFAHEPGYQLSHAKLDGFYKRLDGTRKDGITGSLRKMFDAAGLERKAFKHLDEGDKFSSLAMTVYVDVRLQIEQILFDKTFPNAVMQSA